MYGNAPNSTEWLENTLVATLFKPIFEVERYVFRNDRKPALMVKLNALGETMEKEFPFHKVAIEFGRQVILLPLSNATFIEIVKSEILRMHLHEKALLELWMVYAV